MHEPIERGVARAILAAREVKRSPEWDLLQSHLHATDHASAEEMPLAKAIEWHASRVVQAWGGLTSWECKTDTPYGRIPLSEWSLLCQCRERIKKVRMEQDVPPELKVLRDKEIEFLLATVETYPPEFQAFGKGESR